MIQEMYVKICMAGQLKSNELMVNIQLDEIHLKSNVVYNNVMVDVVLLILR